MRLFERGVRGFASSYTLRMTPDGNLTPFARKSIMYLKEYDWTAQWAPYSCRRAQIEASQF